ncbi:L-proline trans-4-hydroxylase-like [Watersipora subatra]|uniref:L-proline trans-4-hydroxylase-like n=1 Tax=Watersipora subatra TaxID=2589382 RepID=UPI00355BB92C
MSYENITDSVFTLDSCGDFQVTPEVYDSYWKYGYILIRSILSSEEVKLVEEGWNVDPTLQQFKYKQRDASGALMNMALWDDASMDASGLFSRSQKLAGTVEQLFGAEVYHYHAKYLCKPAHTGGSFIWHQDYGYWYFNGTLFPDDMCTAFLAVDDITAENGCLKIIPTSHKCGRIEHIKYDDQIQADLERVEHYKRRLGLKQVEMNKGDVLIFHSNILHRSDVNDSDKRRLAFATAFNTKRNNPTKAHHHPCYKAMAKVENTALLEWGQHKTWDSNKVFYDPRISKDHMNVIESTHQS